MSPQYNDISKQFFQTENKNVCVLTVIVVTGIQFGVTDCQ